MRPLTEAGDGGARSALALPQNPTRFPSTVQIGITLVGILAGAFGGARIAEQISTKLDQSTLLAPYSEAIGLAVVVVIIIILSLIVGELVPKRLALNSPERIAARVARPMPILATASGPVVWFLTIATDGILRLLRVRLSSETAITEEEVRMLIAEGTETGVFDESERSVVESAFDLSETRV